MFLVKKPIKFNYVTQSIHQDGCILCSDFLYNMTSTSDIEVTGVSYEMSEFLDFVNKTIGFNPYRDISDFLTSHGNASNKDMDHLTDSMYVLLADLRPVYRYYAEDDTNHSLTSYNTLDNISFSDPYVSEGNIGRVEANNEITFRSQFTGILTLRGATSGSSTSTLTMFVFPSSVFNNGKMVLTQANDYKRVRISFTRNNLTFKITSFSISFGISPQPSVYNFTSFFEAINTSTLDDVYTDNIDNPYENIDGGSEPDGGNGAGAGADIDGIDPAALPDLPNISAISSGLVTVYMPTAAQLNLLGDFLWSSGFDLADLKKLFADPMDAMIGLSILPVTPSSAGNKSVKFGDVDTGVSMPYTSNQFVRVSCGSVRIDEYVGCFMDYAPYVNIQIYLPGIGIRDLSPDDCMNETLTLTYHIDVITGGCAAFIQCGSKGILYQFNGSLIANVPLTANNYSGAIQNAVSAVLSGAGVVAGAVTGAAPLTAMGAVGLAQSAANTALNAKPQIERSGNMGGSAGILSIQKPYIIINRPNMSVPRNINTFVGNCLNVTMKLKNCSGFTMVQFINLNNVTCTDDEKQELLKLLNEGVIL